MGRRPPRQPPDRARRAVALSLAALGLVGPAALPGRVLGAQGDAMLIDDFTDPSLTSKLNTRWRGVSDQVMGGVSQARVAHETIGSRPCLRLTGDVRLENDGGFIQAALDLASPGDTLDASAYAGVRLLARGNGERYSVHLRTPDNTRPWQSYRAQFTASPDWQTIELPFESFVPYRLDAALDTARLRRLGLVAIGRAFHADLAVCRLAFYR